MAGGGGEAAFGTPEDAPSQGKEPRGHLSPSPRDSPGHLGPVLTQIPPAVQRSHGVVPPLLGVVPGGRGCPRAQPPVLCPCHLPVWVTPKPWQPPPHPTARLLPLGEMSHGLTSRCKRSLGYRVIKTWQLPISSSELLARGALRPSPASCRGNTGGDTGQAPGRGHGDAGASPPAQAPRGHHQRAPHTLPTRQGLCVTFRGAKPPAHPNPFGVGSHAAEPPPGCFPFPERARGWRLSQQPRCDSRSGAASAPLGCCRPPDSQPGTDGRRQKLPMNNPRLMSAAPSRPRSPRCPARSICARRLARGPTQGAPATHGCCPVPGAPRRAHGTHGCHPVLGCHPLRVWHPWVLPIWGCSQHVHAPTLGLSPLGTLWMGRVLDPPVGDPGWEGAALSHRTLVSPLYWCR